MSARKTPIEPSLSIDDVAIPREFADMPPINPADRERPDPGGWRGMAGLSADVAYYSRWVRDEAFRRVGHLYPKVRLPGGSTGAGVTATAWLWARAIACPSCGASAPLLRSFWLTSARGPATWLEPQIGEGVERVLFEVSSGEPPAGQRAIISAGARNLGGARGAASFRCLACGAGIAKRRYVGREAVEGRDEHAPVAIVVDDESGCAFARFDAEQLEAVRRGRQEPHAAIGQHSARQLASLAAFAEAIGRARPYVVHDMIDHYSTGSSSPYATVERDVESYASAIVACLAFALGSCAAAWSTSAAWNPQGLSARPWPEERVELATRGFAEVNPFCDAPSGWASRLRAVARAIEALSTW